MPVPNLKFTKSLRSHGIQFAEARNVPGSFVIPSTGYALFVKRGVDILLASILIVALLSWMIPVLFILIRLDSAGPLFFIQQRGGRDGKPFPCIKFRTMRINAARDLKSAEIGDKRITSMGHFLRKTHLDELPQLINVLRNEMSLVGPRPHMLYHDTIFSALFPNYPLRQSVKPGITGLAQSLGYFGATPDLRTIACRTRLDLFYIQRVSLTLDLSILFKTIKVLF
ncbi:MAG: sugar transferase [Bacteroidetes bacterium]|nr:sugar transferase [Bacteroidota bacterium]